MSGSVVPVELWVAGLGLVIVVWAASILRNRRSDVLSQATFSEVDERILTADSTFTGNDTSVGVHVSDDAAGADISDVGVDDPMTSAVHVVPPDVAEFLIPEFRPGLDICQVDLCYPHIEFVHWRSPGMAAMMFTDGAETLTVFFQGLDVVPFDGVFVRFDHPRKGPQSYLLAELLDVHESEISEAAAAVKKETTLDTTDCELETGSSPMEFMDFDTTTECIEVFVPEGRLNATKVAISRTANGTDSEVLVDGRVAAILRGAIDAGPRNVKLVAVNQTAAA